MCLPGQVLAYKVHQVIIRTTLHLQLTGKQLTFCVCVCNIRMLKKEKNVGRKKYGG